MSSTNYLKGKAPFPFDLLYWNSNATRCRCAAQICNVRVEVFGGDVKFVVAGSGHIAGVINPPQKNKYQYWTGPKPHNADIDCWLANAKEHPGSWWPDWLVWITTQSATEIPARMPGAGELKPIEDAPGSYVKAHD